MRIGEGELAARAPARAEYNSRVVLQLTHSVVDEVVPLQPGATYQDGGYGATVDSISSANGDATIRLREWRAMSVWERRARPRYSFYLRNALRGEALALNPSGPTFMSDQYYLPIAGITVDGSVSGFRVRRLVLSLPPSFTGFGPVADTQATDEAWISNAELVIIRTTQEGVVERTLHIPNLPLEKPKPPQFPPK